MCYCHGKLLDGTIVDVTLPFVTLDKNWSGKKKTINAQLIGFGKREGLFLKKTGIFDAISTFC